MSESTCVKLIYRFCTSVVTAGGEYLREPNIVDTTRLLSIRVSWDVWKHILLHRGGRTIYLVSMVNIRDMSESALSYLKPWLQKTYRFDTLFFFGNGWFT
jgi:hypothetical protein